MFTFRSKAIFTFPNSIYPRCFSTFSRKPTHKPLFSSYIVLHGELNSSQCCRSLSSSPTVSFLQRNAGFAVLRCISSISSSAASTVEWNDSVSGSEIGGRVEVVGLEEEDEINVASKASIPVRAYFFSTRFEELVIFQFLICFDKFLTVAWWLCGSVDLKSLVEQNKQNFIPPSSRMTNYVVLRFGDLKPDPNVSSFLLNKSHCHNFELCILLISLRIALCLICLAEVLIVSF